MTPASRCNGSQAKPPVEAYKIVRRVGASRKSAYVTTRGLTRSYSETRKTTARVGGLTAFTTLELARAFRDVQSDASLEIWFVHCWTPISLPSCRAVIPTMARVQYLWEGGSRPCTRPTIMDYVWWPHGTRAFRSMRLVRKIDDEE